MNAKAEKVTSSVSARRLAEIAIKEEVEAQSFPGRLPLLRQMHWNIDAAAYTANEDIWSALSDGDIDTRRFAKLLSEAEVLNNTRLEIESIVREHRSHLRDTKINHKSTQKYPTKNVDSARLLDNDIESMYHFTKEQYEAAEQWGVPVEELGRLAAVARANTHATKRETTQHGDILTPERIKIEKKKARLRTLELQYRQRLEAIELPEDGFTTDAQSLAAGRLAGTFQQMTQLQTDLGLDVTQKDARVRRAETLRMAYSRACKKAKRPLHRTRYGGDREATSPRP